MPVQGELLTVLGGTGFLGRRVVHHALEAELRVRVAARRDQPDLFGGTGSLAFESLSRGASKAAIFETDADCAEAIRRNGEKLKYGDRVTLWEESCFGAVFRLQSRELSADLIFVDPPYALYKDEGEWKRLRELVAELPRSEGATVVLEHRTGFTPPDRIGTLEAGRNRTYGGTTVTLYT